MATDKRHFSMRLSDDVRVMIEELAGRWEVSQTRVVEIAVRAVHDPPQRQDVELHSDWNGLMQEFHTLTRRINDFMQEYSNIHTPPIDKYLPPRSRPRRKKPGGNKNQVVSPVPADVHG